MDKINFIKTKYEISVNLRININQPLNFVFQKITDVSNWHNLSSNFDSSELIIKNDHTLLTKVASKHNKMTFERYTIRKLIENESMKFNHINTTFPIKKHSGTWKFISLNSSSTQLFLEHNFIVYSGFIGFLFGKFILAPFFFKQPSQKMLLEMKQVLEKSR